MTCAQVGLLLTWVRCQGGDLETVIEDTAINPFAQTFIRGGGARVGTR